MKDTLAKAFTFAGHKANGIAHRLNPPVTGPHESEFMRWFADKGDSTHRVEYDLDADSVVLDAGGYLGDWAAEIAARYGCKIHVFEPLPQYAEIIRHRFKANRQITVHECALSDQTGESTISVLDDSTSMHRTGVESQTIQTVDVAQFLGTSSFPLVNLFKINIEGEEYPLLERILEQNLQGKIDNFQIQFHDLSSESEARMKAIQSRLSATHHPTYQYPFVWENWKANS